MTTDLSLKDLELLIKILRRYTATPDHEADVDRLYVRFAEMLYDYRPVS